MKLPPGWGNTPGAAASGAWSRRAAESSGQAGLHSEFTTIPSQKAGISLMTQNETKQQQNSLEEFKNRFVQAENKTSKHEDRMETIQSELQNEKIQKKSKWSIRDL